MKTDKEIAAEIAALEGCKAYVPKRTLFGDDNHEKLDAQIRVLKEKLDEDDCAKEFLHGGELDEDGDPDERAFDVERAACEAAKWLHDDGDAPHADWDSFKQRKVGKNPALGAGYKLTAAQAKGDPYRRVAKHIADDITKKLKGRKK